jgi:(p)ppGpp synthase/HD superfamily hydrolase
MDKKEIIKIYAQQCYDDANCVYGLQQNYFVHINMVVENLLKYSKVFNLTNDAINTLYAGYTHDLQEDAKQSYNDISKICGKEVADITLAVTDVPAENRLMKHLLTMGKTVRDHRAIILKMCDMLANATFSRDMGSKMYKKYVAEYAYRKPIFQMALAWYKDKLNQEELAKLWEELDEIHNNN